MSSKEVAISFLIPAKNAAETLEHTVNTVHNFLHNNFSGNFEIIVIPNGKENCEELAKTIEVARLLQRQYGEQIVIAEHSPHKPGKGAALNSGFMASSGKQIFFTDADLPYDLDFFKKASSQINEGYDFVTGNRRTAESYFTVPVKALPFVYSRHLCGLLFNRAVRFLFNIKTQDTQAGIKAMSRRFAEAAFSRQICPGFFFDVEFFLVNDQNGFKKNEIPVHLHLKDEKTTLNLLREACISSYWLSKISAKSLSGHYKMKDAPALSNYSNNCHITADDWGLSPAVNRGILKLAQDGIVNRVSILADAAYANLYLDELKQIKNIEVGLHLNLTYNTKHDSPGKLLLYTLNPFVPAKRKRAYFKFEVEKQISLLKELSLPISHIDGHHHCHIFPYVSKVVAQAAQAHSIFQTRLPTEKSLWKTSRFILPLFSLYARHVFQRAKLEYRPFFYPTLSLFQDSEKFKDALKNKGGFEVIVHPATEGDLHLIGCEDDYNHQRVIEFNGLSTLSA